jgi:O-antigen ligase
MWPVAAALAVGCGLAVAYAPEFALLPFAVCLFYVLVGSPAARAAFVVLGGILVLQSSEGFSALKLVYLVGAGIAVFAALAQIGTAPRVARAHLAPLGWISVGLAAVVAVSVFVASGKGISTSEWARDALTYGLLAASPLLALDMSRLPLRQIRWLLCVAGGWAVLAFTAAWLYRRGLTSLDLGRFSLSSYMLAAGFFCFACASAVTADRSRLVWLLAAIATVALLLASGTRSVVVLALAPLVVALTPGAGFGQRVGRTVASLAVAALFLPIVFGAVLGALSVDQAAVTRRFASIVEAYRDPVGDASYRERRIVSNLAWTEFKRAPLLGNGPGHRFTYYPPYGVSARSVLVVDNGLTTLAKLGLVGAGLIVLMLFFLALVGLRAWRSARSPGSVALIAFIVLASAYVFLGAPAEDKGFSFAVALLLAMTARELAETESSPAPRR